MDATVAVPYALGLVMLAGALLPDLRTRRVPNLWWLPFLAMAVVMLVGHLAWQPTDWIPVAVAVGLCAAFYGLWRLRMFGGADAKALMVLALLAPRTPHNAILPVPPALDALVNGTLLLLALPLVLVALNAVRGDWAPAMLLGWRMDLDAAQRRHVWPMQWPDETGQIRWRYWRLIGMDVDQAYAALRRHGVRRVWTTPKIPLIGALLLGLAASWFWGNLVVALAEALTA